MTKQEIIDEITDRIKNYSDDHLKGVFLAIRTTHSGGTMEMGTMNRKEAERAVRNHYAKSEI
jgi:hypothetical protein